MIGNMIRVDATLRLGHEPILEGHQGQMILSSIFMFDRSEISSISLHKSTFYNLNVSSLY